MKFDQPAGINPADRGRVIGQPTPRIDGPLKVTGTAPYAGEQPVGEPAAAVGVVIGAGIAKGRVKAMELRAARAAPGVITIVTAASAGLLGKPRRNTARLLGGPEVQHYHQALAVVVAATFEQARAAAALVKIRYDEAPGRFDLAAQQAGAPLAKDSEQGKAQTRVGDFEGAFAAAQVQLDARYTTPDQSHAMMEPHATLAAWDGDQLTVWTSNQMIDWAATDLARTFGIPKAQVRVRSPYVGGGFGGKLFLRADVVLAALAARAARRPVKLTLQRALIANNTTHRPATLQRLRIGAGSDGRITAIGHESWSGDLPGGQPELAAAQTRLLYAGAHRLTAMRLAVLDLPEGNAMRAPGEAPGLMALEIAMDEMAEKLGLDPVEFRLRNDTLVDPEHPERPFSQRRLAECLRLGAERFGWQRRLATPAQRREGDWLIGLGVAAGLRNHIPMKSRARVHLAADGRVTVDTDMTDIGTGSYTILAQTAAEVLGLPLARVTVRLGDSDFPVSCGSGGQWGAGNSTAGVYAACMKVRGLLARQAGLGSLSEEATLADGHLYGAGGRALPLASLVGPEGLSAEDGIEFGDLAKRFQQSTFVAHFVEVAVDAVSGEARVRRMLAVCAAGRILNPLAARSQVIGAMTMGVGAALMEALHVDPRRGFFVNHDLAGYEVPAHADIPHQDVIFLDEADALASPIKAKGVGELGLCGVAAALANAVYNATGVRVRDYPLTLEKLLPGLPALA